MYKSEHQPVLARTIALLSGPGTQVLWATLDCAGGGNLLCESLQEHGFQMRDISEDLLVAGIIEEVSDWAYSFDFDSRGPISVIEMHRPAKSAGLVGDEPHSRL